MSRFRHVSHWNCLGLSTARRPRPHVQRHLSGELIAQRRQRHQPTSQRTRTATVRPIPLFRAVIATRHAVAHSAVAEGLASPWPPRPKHRRRPPPARRKAEPSPRRGAVGARPPHAAQRQRADQEGRRRSQRADTDRDDLRPPGLRLDRRRRPARPDALVGAVHPAQARDRRRQDRDPGAGGAGRQVLHAAGPHRRRAADDRSSCAAIGEVSEEFARGTADITDRQNIQLHWIRIEDVPEIWRRLEAVGLSTTEACGDTPRVILGSPVAGIAADEIIDGTPAIEEIQRRYIGDPAFSNLPRKFKTAISGSPQQDVAHEINDVAFVGVVHPEHGPGFDLWVGGGLSTNPQARAYGSAPGCRWTEVAGGLGGRHLDLPRLRLPAAAHPRPAEVPGRRLGRREVPRGAGERVPRAAPLIDGPAPEQPAGALARPRRRAPAAGRPVLRRRRAARRPGVRRDARPRSPTLAEAHGSGRVRTTAEQKMIVLDVERGPGRPRWSRGWRRWTCESTRRRSGAARWPAPASSSASWRSSRPRRAAPR